MFWIFSIYQIERESTRLLSLPYFCVTDGHGETSEYSSKCQWPSAHTMCISADPKNGNFFLKSYFTSGSGGHIGLETAQFQHVFNKYTNSQLSQTKIMEILDVFKKMCQKIQYRKLIDADNNYSNSQFAQNARRRTQKKTFSMRKCRNHPSDSVSFLASIADSNWQYHCF